MRIRRAPPSAHWLEAELNRAKVVSPANLPENVISMHSVFDFQDGITDQVRRATLVYPGEEDQGIGRISVLSPHGSGLGQSMASSSQWCAHRTWGRSCRHTRDIARQPAADSVCRFCTQFGDHDDA
jgi:hypothetical protein